MNYNNDLSYATANGVSDLMEAQAHIQKAIERLTRASKELPEVVDARYPEDARQLYLTLRQQVIHAHQVIAYLQSNALPNGAESRSHYHTTPCIDTCSNPQRNPESQVRNEYADRSIIAGLNGRVTLLEKKLLEIYSGGFFSSSKFFCLFGVKIVPFLRFKL